jgi:hypothetical protein
VNSKHFRRDVIFEPVQNGFLAEVVMRVVNALKGSVNGHKDGIVGGGGVEVLHYFIVLVDDAGEDAGVVALGDFFVDGTVWAVVVRTMRGMAVRRSMRRRSMGRRSMGRMSMRRFGAIRTILECWGWESEHMLQFTHSLGEETWTLIAMVTTETGVVRAFRDVEFIHVLVRSMLTLVVCLFFLFVLVVFSLAVMLLIFVVFLSFEVFAVSMLLSIAFVMLSFEVLLIILVMLLSLSMFLLLHLLTPKSVLFIRPPQPLQINLLKMLHSLLQPLGESSNTMPLLMQPIISRRSNQLSLSFVVVMMVMTNSFLWRLLAWRLDYLLRGGSNTSDILRQSRKKLLIIPRNHECSRQRGRRK